MDDRNDIDGPDDSDGSNYPDKPDDPDDWEGSSESSDPSRSSACLNRRARPVHWTCPCRRISKFIMNSKHN